MELAEALSLALSDTVIGLRRKQSGASRETWSFAVGDGSRRILQLPPSGVDMRADAALEADVLRAVAAAGVPVPRVIATLEDAEWPLRGGLVVEELPGESLPQRLLREDRFAAARNGLAAACGTLLARIHSIAPESLSGLQRVDPVDRCRSVLDSLSKPQPALELVLRLLELDRPPRRTPTVVHGDFRLGNLLVDEAGITGVLDWETAHAGDPAEDLGYLCVRAWRFGLPLPVAGVGTYAELLDSYHRSGGLEVTLHELLWWQALGTVWWGAVCQLQAHRRVSDASRSLELAAVGRRTCEQEWDALEAITEIDAHSRSGSGLDE